jgi:hypothetical protein
LLAAGTALAWLGNVRLTYILGTAGILLWARFAFTSYEYRRLWSFVSTSAALFTTGER